MKTGLKHGLKLCLLLLTILCCTYYIKSVYKLNNRYETFTDQALKSKEIWICYRDSTPQIVISQMVEFVQAYEEELQRINHIPEQLYYFSFAQKVKAQTIYDKKLFEVLLAGYYTAIGNKYLEIHMSSQADYFFKKALKFIKKHSDKMQTQTDLQKWVESYSIYSATDESLTLEAALISWL